MKHVNLNDITLQKMLIFTTSAKYENFTLAADALFVTQPLISRTIRDLESLLGIQLFIRNNHSVKLTPQGEILCKYWNAILSMTSKSIEVTNKAGPESGFSIMIADEVNFDKTLYLEPIVNEYKKRHPEAEVNVAFIYGSTAIESVSDEVYDLAFCVTDIKDSINDINIHMKELHDFRLCVDFPKGHPLANEKEISIDEIINMPLVLYYGPESQCYNDLILKIYRQQGYAPIVHSYVCNETTFNYLRGSEGLITITNELQEKSRYKEVYSVPIKNVYQNLCIIWNSNTYSPKVEEFLHIAIDYFNHWDEHHPAVN